MEATNDVSKEQLLSDMRVVVNDLEALLRATAGSADADVRSLSEGLKARLAGAKSRLLDAEAVLVEKGRKIARDTDDYVHDNPWKSVGIAAGVGLVVGILIGRR